MLAIVVQTLHPDSYQIKLQEVIKYHNLRLAIYLIPKKTDETQLMKHSDYELPFLSAQTEFKLSFNLEPAASSKMIISMLDSSGSTLNYFPLIVSGL